MRRPAHQVGVERSLLKRHPLITSAIALVAGSSALSLLVPALHTYPEALTISTGDTWNDVIEWLNVNHHENIGGFRDFFIIYLLKPVKIFFIRLPWVGVILVLATLGFALGGFRLALLTAVLLSLIALCGYWKQADVLNLSRLPVGDCGDADRRATRNCSRAQRKSEPGSHGGHRYPANSTDIRLFDPGGDVVRDR